jgi:hypothetical protein
MVISSKGMLQLFGTGLAKPVSKHLEHMGNVPHHVAANPEQQVLQNNLKLVVKILAEPS